MRKAFAAEPPIGSSDLTDEIPSSAQPPFSFKLAVKFPNSPRVARLIFSLPKVLRRHLLRGAEIRYRFPVNPSGITALSGSFGRRREIRELLVGDGETPESRFCL